ncbi:MAG: phosphoenolpyruvate mutase [Clostridia bacterium]|nr:phosphoenolpyruvate mutase [Clostridia bacterium]MBQ4538710.1 phosphoenolpyruvate mutase [Oscillospiraceae bacterium]
MDINFKGIMPNERLGSLRKLLEEKKFVRIMEAHNGLTGRIVETVSATREDGETVTYDGMWVSSLCDSTAKAKPDIELVDFTSRCGTIEQILEVTTKPIILDGDTGGKIEHLVYNVRTLERLGISAIIIEDKVGLKKNSLFGTDVVQQQDTIEHFCEKIAAVKAAQMTKEFMCFARCESLILKQGMEDALKRTNAYVEAGADGILIHSKEKSPAEVVEFLQKFKADHPDTPVVVVPTSYNTITEEELKSYGVNVVIYANHLVRSAYPAMMNTAKSILEHQRAAEADSEYCMSIKQILTLIPDSL